MKSPTKSRRSIIKFDVKSCYDLVDESEVMADDLRLIRSQEMHVYSLNDELIALNRVVNETINSLESTKNTLRAQRLRVHRRHTDLQERQRAIASQASEFAALTASQQELVSKTSALSEEVAELQKSLEVTLTELSESYHAIKTEDPALKVSHQDALECHRRQRAVVDHLQTEFDSLKAAAQRSETSLRDSERAYRELTSAKSQLEDSMPDLDEREAVATLAIRQPCDELIPETEFVLAMEADVQELLKLCQRSDDDQLDGDITRATQKCETFEAAIAERREALRAREQALVAASAAQTSRPQVLSQMGPSAEERIPQMQLMTAQRIVTGLFDKLEKRQEAIGRENDDLDELADAYQGQRVSVEGSWKSKVKEIAELQEQLLKSQRLVVDVAAAAAKIDQLSRDLMEGKYNLQRLQRQAARLADRRAQVELGRAPLDAIRSDIEGKTKEIERIEAELVTKREEVSRLVRDVEEEERAADEIEAAGDEKENQAKATHHDLESAQYQIDKSYQALCFARLQAGTLE
jgi:chromosome segregation ATPase